MIARSLFILMLLANLGFYGWQLTSQAAETPQLPDTQPGIPSLVLLSERDAATAMPVVAGGADQDQLDLSCHTLGPLPSRVDARRVAESIAADVFQFRQRETREQRAIGHWVYLPAVATRDDALAIARELSAQGMRDYYVVTAGDQENTISLGLFRDENNALRRQQLVVALGFPAQLTQRIDETPVYWIDYAADTDAEVSWQAALGDTDEASRRPIDCVGDLRVADAQ